jgi:pyridoxal 5'-phosphate synthase pdxT subunit
MEIGVLALQGAFAKHGEMLNRLGIKWREVRTASDLNNIDGLIIPGGESTTMLKLMKDENLFEPLKKFVHERPTFGTCAGVILLARDVRNPSQASLGAMDITVERNGYGRQIDSFSGTIEAPEISSRPVEAVFIRAPIIASTGPEVKVLANRQNSPVLIEQGHCLGATFHPELTNDTSIHERFLAMIENSVAAV